MTPSKRFEDDDLGLGDEASRPRRTGADAQSRRTRTSIVRKLARRNRSNEMAKRGMHQRRNKRSGW